MKRVLAMLFFLIFLLWFFGAFESGDFELSESYELVAMEYNVSSSESAKTSVFLFCYGYEEETKAIYGYMYKRDDGGIIPATTDSGTVVIYEDDLSNPKLEVWSKGRGLSRVEEYRFTIPTGSIVNYYNPQGIDQNQKEKSE